MNTKDIKWVKLTVKTDLEFFTEWLKIIKSFSPLTDKEAEFMAILLTKRHELSKVILDEKILTKMLFDKEVKNYIVSELKMKDTQSVENMIYTLKKKNVIFENKIINPRYIPRVSKDFTNFAIGFEIVKDGQGQ
jgi:hypothetical protein